MFQNQSWDDIPALERLELIEKVVAGTMHLSDLLSIDGATHRRIGFFIEVENQARAKSGTPILPPLDVLSKQQVRTPKSIPPPQAVVIPTGPVQFSVTLPKDPPQVAAPPQAAAPPQDTTAPAPTSETVPIANPADFDPDKENRIESGIEFSQDMNKCRATLTTHINDVTPAQLLRSLEMDPEEWIVEKYEKNEWNGFIKNKAGDAETVPLKQYKATLRAKIAKPAWPIVHPVAYNFTSPELQDIPEPIPGQFMACLIMGDSQNGYRHNPVTGEYTEYHDRRMWDLGCQFAQILQKQGKLSKVVLLGDHCDFADWSLKFATTPDMTQITQATISELAWWLTRLRIASGPNTEIHYLEGNHEQRLRKFIAVNTAQACGLKTAEDFLGNGPTALSVANLLGLNRPSLNIKYHEDYPDDSVYINDNIWAEHGFKAKGVGAETVKAVLSSTTRGSVVFGHIHRRESATRCEHYRDQLYSRSAESFGCMCHVDGRVPGSSKKRSNWNQGFGIVWYQPGDGLFHTEYIPVIDGRASYRGEVYVGSTNVDAISNDTKIDFRRKS